MSLCNVFLLSLSFQSPTSDAPMIFLASLLYTVTFPLLALGAAMVGRLSPLGGKPTSALILLGAYVVILALLHVTKLCWRDLQEQPTRLQRQLREYLDVRGVEWLNMVGATVVGMVTAILLSAGVLPFPLWFLFGAVVLGCVDLIRKRKTSLVPPELPLPRSDLADADCPPKEGGQEREFTWQPWSPELRALECCTKLLIDEGEYQHSRQREHSPVSQPQAYARYVREGCSAAVKRAARFFRNRSSEHGLPATQEMEDVVCFVRGISYTSDGDARGGQNRPRFPAETLYDQAGDCEDHAILAASILHELGHDVALFLLTLSGEEHLALAYRADGLTCSTFTKIAEGRAYSIVQTLPPMSVESADELATSLLSEIQSAEVVLL